LNTQENVANANLATWTPKLEADKTIIKSVATIKASAEAADATLGQVKTLIPDGSPVAWFPPLIIEFFKRQGIEKCAVHHEDEGLDRELVGFKRASWGLDISHVEVVQLATAIAAFENEHPLMEINTLQIEGSQSDVQFQTARLNVYTVIKE
jgi:hypothetical protein